jgi:hypothetical protein
MMNPKTEAIVTAVLTTNMPPATLHRLHKPLGLFKATDRRVRFCSAESASLRRSSRKHVDYREVRVK